ncbi:MAG: hypothetical protein ABJ208_27105, partial [Rhodopirellula bahusiensis]
MNPAWVVADPFCSNARVARSARAFVSIKFNVIPKLINFVVNLSAPNTTALTGVVAVRCFDGDGIPNNEDLDSDNDGIPDVVETGNGSLDLDGNGSIDPGESNHGSNGIPDVAEDGGTDGAGVSAIPLNSDN